MPQLSPLNWIFLYVLFWGSVLLMSVFIWWFSKVYFENGKMDSLTLVKGNKWRW